MFTNKFNELPRQGQHFFFAKKKQKTPIWSAVSCLRTQLASKSFLVLFFKKECFLRQRLDPIGHSHRASPMRRGAVCCHAYQYGTVLFFPFTDMTTPWPTAEGHGRLLDQSNEWKERRVKRTPASAGTGKHVRGNAVTANIVDAGQRLAPGSNSPA